MLRLVEIGLFASPFVIYAIWLVVGRRLSVGLFWAIIVTLLVLCGGTVWFGLDNSLPKADGYVPARVVNGRIVPGHGVPP